MSYGVQRLTPRQVFRRGGRHSSTRPFLFLTPTQHSTTDQLLRHFGCVVFSHTPGPAHASNGHHSIRKRRYHQWWHSCVTPALSEWRTTSRWRRVHWHGACEVSWAERVGVQYPLIEANLLVVKPVTKLTNVMALDNTLQSFPRSYSTHLPLPYLQYQLL